MPRLPAARRFVYYGACALHRADASAAGSYYPDLERVGIYRRLRESIIKSATIVIGSIRGYARRTRLIQPTADRRRHTIRQVACWHQLPVALLSAVSILVPKLYFPSTEEVVIFL